MQTRCTNDHPFDDENTYYARGSDGHIRRYCRACHRNSQKNYKRRNKRRLKAALPPEDSLALGDYEFHTES